MANNTNDSSGIAGFHFQDMAALYLFLDNVKDLNSFEVEGKEDISLFWNDGTMTMVQAKETKNPYETFNKGYIQKGLEVLSKDLNDYGTEKIKSEIFLTNSNFPFGKRNGSEFTYSPYVKFDNGTLPPKMKKVLLEINEKVLGSIIDFNKLNIMKINYWGSDEATKLSELKNKILEFMESACIVQGKYHIFLTGLTYLVYRNAEEDKKTISKKDFAGDTACTLLLDSTQLERFFEMFDISIGNEEYIRNQYAEYLKPLSFDFELITQVNDLERSYVVKDKKVLRNEKIKLFVNDNYKKICGHLGIDAKQEKEIDIAKFILWSITINNTNFNNIKEALNYED